MPRKGGGGIPGPGGKGGLKPIGGMCGGMPGGGKPGPGGPSAPSRLQGALTTHT